MGSTRIDEAMASRKPGLQSLQFRCVASAGIGDCGNSYPHAMEWFQDHLFVATGRHYLAAIYSSEKARKNWIFETAPVRVPESLLDLDFRSQIWRYHPPTATWEKVMTSPTVEIKPGIHRPVFAGMRNMAVFPGEGERPSALYGTSFSGTGGTGVLVRTENGTDFDLLQFSGFDAEAYSSFRPLVAFRGRLFTGTTGGRLGSGSGNACGVAAVLATRDPVREPWTLANADNFGDSHNEGLFEMAVFDDHLYAGTINPDGAQLWKTDGEGELPFHWTRVFDRGAGRGSHNQCVSSFCVLRDALYVGVSAVDGGYDRDRGIGPCAAELIRVFPDDTWEIVCGDGRLTDQGLKLPISGLGPGFNNPMNGYIWRLAEYEGALYAGTYCATAVIPFLDRSKLLPEVNQLMTEDRCNLLLDLLGGCDVWRSVDGVIWRPVTLNGFRNLFNMGVRTLQSTPDGLFVGCANGYGPEVAVKREGGWKYEPNPRGGFEIWTGHHDISVASHEQAARGFDGGWAELIAKPPVAGNQPFPPDEDPVQQLISGFYRSSGFRTCGYWTRHVQRADQACERLLTELTSLLDQAPTRILELGANSSATAAYITREYPQATMIGIDVGASSEAPPTADLPPGPFDLVMNLETLGTCENALHWIRASLKVLEPGGSWLGAVVLSDRIDTPWLDQAGTPAQSGEAFEALLRAVGFAEVVVRDVTSACWQFFWQRLEEYLLETAITRGLEQSLRDQVKEALTRHMVPVSAYLLVHARADSE